VSADDDIFPDTTPTPAPTAFERVAARRGTDPPRPARRLHAVPDAPAEPARVDVRRPARLSELVGQQRLLMRIRTHLAAAAARGETPGHMLLSGPAGVGKTSIGQAIAAELGGQFHELTGDAVPNARALAVQLAKLEPGDTLLIDECQGLRPAVQLALLRVLEDNELFIEATAKHPSVRFAVPPFLLVGCTTHSGKLTNPMRDRFRFVGHLEQYEPEDLQLIVLSYCERLGVECSLDAAAVIAGASRFTPRRAIRLTDAVRDFAFEVVGDVAAPLDVDTAVMGLEYSGTDRHGLEDRDHRVMRVLLEQFAGGPIGLAPLACALNMDPTELTRDVESYLIGAGLWALMPGGRGATALTWQVETGHVPPLINGRMR
jgi:Holliday junction DNA helicase RuvB